MIKSNIKTLYGDGRIGLKEVYVQLEVSSSSLKNENPVFTIEHYVIPNENAKIFYYSSSVSVGLEKYNHLYLEVDNYILENELDFSQFTPYEKEFMRLKIWLLIYIRTELSENNKTTWGFDPDNWFLV